MNITTATAYLEEIEHADPRAAKAAARVLAELLESHWFFRPWWCEALEPCLASSPRMVGRPDTVLARLTHHFGLRVASEAPPCHTCRRPLRLTDVRVTTPTGRCRGCRPVPAAAAVPEPRVPSTSPRDCVTAPAATRKGGDGR